MLSTVRSTNIFVRDYKYFVRDYFGFDIFYCLCFLLLTMVFCPVFTYIDILNTSSALAFFIGVYISLEDVFN